jgi:hypothetical protein
MAAYMPIESYHKVHVPKMKSTHINAAVLLVKKGKKGKEINTQLCLSVSLLFKSRL